MRRTLTLTLLATALAAPAAEAGSLRMPDYFIDYAVEMTVANAVVEGCPELGLDPMGLNRVNVAVEARLYEDGLLRPNDAEFAQAVRNSLESDERLAQGLDETYRRLGVDPDDVQAKAARWCAVGRSEMQAASPLGMLLYDMR